MAPLLENEHWDLGIITLNFRRQSGPVDKKWL